MAYSKFDLATTSKMTAVFEKDPHRFSIWTYKSSIDNLATIFAAGYFNDALYGIRGDTTKLNGVINENDIIWIQETDGTNIAIGIIYDNAGVATLRRFDLVPI